MSYTWKDALSKIGKQLNEKIEKVTIHIDDNINDLIERIKTKVHYFNSVSDMKSSNILKVGDMVLTKGYYTTNDGGNGEYEIVNDASLVDDGGSILKLSNGLFAKLIVKNSVYVEQFGVKNAEIDSSDKLQACFNYCSKNHVKCLSNPNSTYNVSKKIVIAGYFNLDFNYSVVKASGVLDKVIEINCETKDSLNCGNIDNLTIDGNGTAAICLYHTCGKEGIINNVRVINATNIGYQIATKGRAPRYVTNLRAESCSVGLRVDADDIMFINIFMKFCNKAIQNFGGSNFFDHVHAWIKNDGDNYSTSVFLEMSTTTFISNSYSDTYKYSFRFNKNYINLFAQNVEVLWNTTLVPSVKTDIPIIFDYAYELTTGQSDEASVNLIGCEVYSQDFKPKIVSDTMFAKASLDFEMQNCRLQNVTNIPKGFYTSLSNRNNWVLLESGAVMKDRRVNYVCKFNIADNTTATWGSNNWISKLDRQEFYPSKTVNVIVYYGKTENELFGSMYAQITTDGFLTLTLPSAQNENMKYFCVKAVYDL